MQGRTQLKRQSVVVLSMLLGGITLTSCQSQISTTQETVPSAAAPTVNLSQKTLNRSDNAQTTQETPTRTRTQLIKKASVTLLVDSVDKSVDAVSQIIDERQGDLIGLNEQQPTEENPRPTASIDMRVPQNLLESTLDEIAKLGTVQNRQITVEDVSSQIVDFQARLSNLRKTETNLQKIMDRSGSVKDILNVAQELSNVRQQIEQIDAQLKSLQNQVAYSTISLKLEATIASSSPQRTFGSQIKDTWNRSSESLGEFSIGLLKIGIWLLVYSPYWFILAIVIYRFKRWLRSPIS
jgi:DNA repair ATPase RecN